MVCSLWPPAKYSAGQPCSTDNDLITAMTSVVAFIEYLNLDEAMIQNRLWNKL